MIKFQHVSKRYSNGHLALNDVNFQLETNEFAFLTGCSGAGKSTMLKLIAAIEFASYGHITVGKYQLNRLRQYHVPYFRREIGIILQTPQLLLDRTILDNVSLPLIVSGHPYVDIRSRARAVLAKVSLQNKEKCFPNELSTGEQQRVAIARAIINKPPLLIADEPTGNLDAGLAADMMNLFEQFNQLGMTILIATHDLNLINKLKHRVFTLNEGKLTCDA